MGTNYYAESDRCAACGRKDEPMHIGKSSAGWCFGLHIYPEHGIHDLDDWVREWEAKHIVDEYGESVSKTEMLRIITERSFSRGDRSAPLGCESIAVFHARNHSQDGPNGLLRRQLGMGTVKHGAGTWDCLVGEFS
jgi:hypothetical protein